MPEINSVSDEAWANYVIYEQNDIGVVLEWWLHSPSSYWFIAERHNASDEILRTYPADELFKERIDFAAREADA